MGAAAIMGDRMDADIMVADTAVAIMAADTVAVTVADIAEGIPAAGFEVGLPSAVAVEAFMAVMADTAAEQRSVAAVAAVFTAEVVPTVAGPTVADAAKSCN
jgi:hypothetical protein